MSAVLPLLIAFLGYSVQNISQATQKIGLGIAGKRRARGRVIWALGTLGTGSSALILLLAVSLGNVALVGAMAGSGLVSLTIFSRLVMREKFGRRELIGVSIILSAAASIALLAREPQPTQVDLRILFIMLFVISGIYIGAILLSMAKGRAVGIIIGGFAGALGGFVAQFQKVSSSPIGQASAIVQGSSYLARLVANPYTLIWVALSMSAMIVLQFAYRRDQAIRIIPAFSANYILVPTLGGVICFGESLSPFQWVAVAAIVAGVLLITTKRRLKPDAKTESPVRPAIAQSV